ncbi:MAG: OmpH family outer membrane protein [Cytophagaceae bacterium]|nr:OmpH family outer membrane protein [Cytophagaceae bacterium]
MKNYILGLLIVLVSITAFSQTKKPAQSNQPKAKVANGFKWAYIYEDYIFEKYNLVKTLDAEVKKKQEAYQETFNKMALEYQTKNLEYQSSMKNLDSMTTEKLTAKLKSVQEIKEASENFQREAEKEIQMMIGDGIVKIKENIKKTAEIVANQKGYKFVILRNKNENLMTGKTVLYAGDGGRDNISDAVLAALGSPVGAKK